MNSQITQSTIKWIGLLLLCLLFSLQPIWANNAPADAEETEMVRKALNKFFAGHFELKELNVGEENGQKILSGAVSFFGTAAVQIRCATQAGAKKLESVEAQFPEGAKFDLGDVQRACGPAFRLSLPRSLSSNAGIQIKNFNLKLNPDGESIQDFKLQLKSKAWDFMNFGSLKLQEVNIDLGYTPAAAQKVSCNITGLLNIAKASFQIQTNIPQDLKSWVINANYDGSAGSISLGDVLNAVGGAELSQSLFAGIPPSFFTGLSLPNFQMELRPGQKDLKLNAANGAGTTEMHLKNSNKGTNGYISYSPPNNFQFGKVSSILSWLDAIKMPLSQVKLTVGNYTGPISKDRTLRPGMDINSKLDLPKEISDFFKGKADNIFVSGHLKDLNSFGLTAKLKLNADLGSGVKVDDIEVGLKSKTTDKLFLINGRISFPVDSKTRIRFKMGAAGKPTSGTVEANLDLDAINNDPNKAEWTEPFDIPYIGIRNLGGTLGLNPATIVGSIGLRGDIRLGKVPTSGQADKRLTGKLDFYLDVPNPINSTMKADLKNTTIAGLLEAFEPSINLTGGLRKALDSGIKNLKADIRPRDGYLQIGGDASILGKAARLEFTASKSGKLAAKGSMDAISVDIGSLKLIEIKGKTQARPNFTIDLSTDPKIYIDGAVSILGRAVEGNFKIDKNGFDIEASGKMFGGLSMTAKVKGSDFSDKEGIMVSLELQQEFMKEAASSIKNFIKKQADKADGDIRKLIAEINAIEASNGLEKVVKEASAGILGLVNDIQGAMAVAGMMIVEGVLETVDIRSITFEGSASSLEAAVSMKVQVFVAKKQYDLNLSVNLNTTDAASLAASVGEAIGKELLNIFSPLEDELKALTKELEEFAKGIEKAFVDAVKELEKGFDKAAEFFEGVAKELDKAWNGETYPAALSGKALAEIKPGIRHYSVTVHRMVAEAVDDGYTAGGVAEEIITFGQSEGKRDQTLELYGPISIQINGGNTFASNGTNNVFWSRNRNGSKYSLGQGGTINVNQTKHIYAPIGQAVTIWVYSRLWEFDDGQKHAADDKIYGSGLGYHVHQMNGTTNFNFLCTESGASHPTKIRVYCSITAHPVMTTADVRNAIRSGNTNTLTTVLKKGGNLYASDLDPLREAVSANKVTMSSYLLANGFKPNTNHLLLAAKSASYNSNLVMKLLVRGAKPNAEVLELALAKRDHKVSARVMEKGVKPTLVQFNRAVSQKDNKLAGLILDHGVMPTTTELKQAVTRKDLFISKLIMGKGVKADINMLNEMVKAKDEGMFNLISASVQPNASSLKAAVDVDADNFFKKMIAQGARATDNSILTTAMDKNKTELVKLSLEYGASANAGLDHAMSKSNKNYMLTSLGYGADPNKAWNYSVTKNDQALAKQLLYEYSGNADALMTEALKAKKLDFGRLALEGGANPTSQIAKAANDNQVKFTNLMLDFGADPNPAMKGTIKNKQAPTLERLIQFGADVNKNEFVKDASELQSLSMVKLLVDAGGPVNAGMPAAVNKDQYDMMYYLLTMGASPKTYVQNTACRGKGRMVLALLEFGGDPNEGMKCATEKGYDKITLDLLNFGGNPKGYIASPSKQGHLKVVQHLVIFGADPNNGLKPAVEGSQLAVTDYLLQNGAIPVDLVKIAAANNKAKIVKSLCDYGDDPEPGMMPAAKGGFVDVAKVVVSFGVDPKPYKYIRASVEGHHPNMIQYLADQGANVNEIDKQGNSLLHIAAQHKGQAPTVQALIKVGVKLEHLDAEGKTALIKAVDGKGGFRRKNFESVKVLVEAGANLAATDEDGKFPMLYCKLGKVRKYLRKAMQDKGLDIKAMKKEYKAQKKADRQQRREDRRGNNDEEEEVDENSDE